MSRAEIDSSIKGPAWVKETVVSPVVSSRQTLNPIDSSNPEWVNEPEPSIIQPVDDKKKEVEQQPCLTPEKEEMLKVSLRYSLLLFVIGLITFFIIDSQTTQWTENGLKDLGYAFLMLSPTWIVICYSLITVAFTVVNVPMTLLAITGGYIFAEKFGFFLGVCIGSTVNIVCFTLGAIICFAISVNFFREVDYIRSYEYLNGLDIALQKNGFLINLLLRITPILPASVLNYSLPALGSFLSDFSFGCLVGTIPYSIIMTVFGAFLANSGSDLVDYLKKLPLWISIVSAVIGCIFFGGTVYILMVFVQREIDELRNDSDGCVADECNGDHESSCWWTSVPKKSKANTNLGTTESSALLQPADIGTVVV